MNTVPARQGSKLALLCAFLLTLSGCWPTQRANLTEQVATVATIIQNYNTAHPRDLAQMGSVCRRAGEDLQNSDAWSTFLSASSRPSTRAYDLRKALQAAHSAFRDCALGTSRLDFELTVRSVREVQLANWWIARVAGERR